MTANKPADEQPIVFACGGESQIAQIANDIAITLQKNHVASMGCISAIANDLPEQLAEAKKSLSIIALDGCPHQCVKKCLSNKNIVIDHYFDLSEIRENHTKESNTASNIKAIKNRNYLQENQDSCNSLLLDVQLRKNKPEKKQTTLVDAMRIMQTVYKELDLKKTNLKEI